MVSDKEDEMYHLLVVDDEPTLVEGLCDYLSSMLSEETDILKAYSGQEAYAIMSQYSIDLLISDIQMPGMDGLELLDKVEQFCPHCNVIFLTSYNTFNWIQEALRHPCCVDYILKTQGDQVIGEAVLKQIKRLDQQNDGKELVRRAAAQMEHLRPYFQQKELEKWLIEGKAAPAVTGGGIHTGKPFLVCLWHCKIQEKALDIYQSLMKKMLKDEFSGAMTEVVFMGWGELAVLIQINSPIPEQSVYSYLYMRMERIQILLENAGLMSDVAILDRWTDGSDIRQSIRQMHDQLAKVYNAEQEVIIRIGSLSEERKNDANEVVRWVKQYVERHISDPNLSLVTIAEKSCYSASYLSRLFKQKEGENLLSYITQVRINTACRLLRERRYSVQQVGRMTGFLSPSYFVAFFKRRVGKTPLQYMRDEQWRTEDESSC